MNIYDPLCDHVFYVQCLYVCMYVWMDGWMDIFGARSLCWRSEYLVAVADTQFVLLFEQKPIYMLENKEDQRETKSWVAVSFSCSTQVHGRTRPVTPI